MNHGLLSEYLHTGSGPRRRSRHALLQMALACSPGMQSYNCYAPSGTLSPGIGGGFFVVLASAFIVAAAAVSVAAAARLRVVAVKGTMPPAPDGDGGGACCLPSVPAINGLGGCAECCSRRARRDGRWVTAARRPKAPLVPSRVSRPIASRSCSVDGVLPVRPRLRHRRVGHTRVHVLRYIVLISCV